MTEADSSWKPCPECHKAMILVYIDYTPIPAGRRWHWWCGCDHTGPGGVEWGRTDEERYRRLWEEINAPAEGIG